MIARLLVDFTKEESEQKLSRRFTKTMKELEKYEEQERQLLEVYYQARKDYLEKLQAWRMRLTAVLSKQEDNSPQHLGPNGRNSCSFNSFIREQNTPTSERMFEINHMGRRRRFFSACGQLERPTHTI